MRVYNLSRPWKSISMFLLVASFPMLLKAQDVYEIRFTAGITQYRCAIILWSDGSSKARVKYYASGQTNLVEQTLKIENTQYGLRLTGYNAINAYTKVKHSSYSPDNFYISQDENGVLVCTNVDDNGVSARCTVRSISGFAAKQTFLADFNWKL